MIFFTVLNSVTISVVRIGLQYYILVIQKDPF